MTTESEKKAFDKGLKDNGKRDWLTDPITGNPPYDPPKGATSEEKRQYERSYYDKNSSRPK